MATRRIRNRVKTANGYDTLISLSPYQIFYASSILESQYKTTVFTNDGFYPTSNDEITSAILVCYTATQSNRVNMTFQVNALDNYPVYLNNAPISANQINNGDQVLVLYDIPNQKATVIAISSFVRLNKATSAQATAGTDDTTYMTPFKVMSAINSVVGSHLSVSTGTVEHNSAIPQTSGYTNYIYFVSPKSIPMRNISVTSNKANVRVVCEVNQSTRVATVGSYLSYSSGWTSWTAGTASYIELAWN